MEKSRSTGKSYFWNKITLLRVWPLQKIEGWGYTFMRDPKRSNKTLKVFVHLLSGKQILVAPGSSAPDCTHVTKKRRVSPTKPSYQKLSQKGKQGDTTNSFKSGAASTAVSRNVHETTAPQHLATTATARPNAEKQQMQEDAPDAQTTQPGSTETATTAKLSSKVKPWSNIDLTPVKITDPKLLRAINWRADPNLWRNQKNSPHVMQAFNNNTIIYRSLSNLPFTSVPFLSFNDSFVIALAVRFICLCLCLCCAYRRSLTPDCPRVPYRRRANEEKTVVRWDDRSLFLVELEFLLRFDKPTTEGLLVICAGESWVFFFAPSGLTSLLDVVFTAPRPTALLSRLIVQRPRFGI